MDQQIKPDRADVFDLVVTDGERRIVMRFDDVGVAPREEALLFTRAGRWVSRRYRDIASVTISSNLIGRGAIGQCIIAFCDGTRVIVMTVNPAGLADAGRIPRFRSFIRAFHERLIASGASGIAFHSGYGKGRMASLTAALVVGGAVFVLLPLVLFLGAGEERALWVMLGGAVLLWPALRIREQNAPQSYDPRNPPDLLR
ncbi:hypothetical protein [Elioraea sp.]|uniref:hypothetical protein n=1 Tax=Elioraea sp. TaxID=2185103 RepID=UPI003F7241D1